MSELTHLSRQFLSIDVRGLQDLKRFFDNCPSEARKATAQVLNDIAFTGRQTAVGVLQDRVIVKNARFALSRMRVEKARSGPISSQVAYLGSIVTMGKSGISHDGWRSLEYGTEPTRVDARDLVTREVANQYAGIRALSVTLVYARRWVFYRTTAAPKRRP